MRGLKPPSYSFFQTYGYGESHLLQMRGLKPPAVGDGMISATSHLLQMRGLKHADDVSDPD